MTFWSKWRSKFRKEQFFRGGSATLASMNGVWRACVGGVLAGGWCGWRDCAGSGLQYLAWAGWMVRLCGWHPSVGGVNGVSTWVLYCYYCYCCY